MSCFSLLPDVVFACFQRWKNLADFHNTYFAFRVSGYAEGYPPCFSGRANDVNEVRKCSGVQKGEGDKPEDSFGAELQNKRFYII